MSPKTKFIYDNFPNVDHVSSDNKSSQKASTAPQVKKKKSNVTSCLPVFGSNTQGEFQTTSLISVI